MEIKKITGETIYISEKGTIREAIVEALTKGVNLRSAILIKADLNGANLSVANLDGADLYGANLSGADLDGADLGDANIRGANLYSANLSGANLNGSNLYSANLRGANLRDANLRGANLDGANLRGADLYGADLNGADLYGANLRGANLRGADLYGANILGANLHESNLHRARNIPYIPMACPSDGEFTAWKKVNKKLVKLLVPADAKRSSATTKKCRCSKARVVSITSLDESESYEKVVNENINTTVYKVGEIVYPDSFDNNRWNECSNGIHFFINKQDAINY